MIRAAAMQHWSDHTPPPEYYGFGLSTIPHLFMSQDRWISGRLHQMRSQGSYLAAHLPWFASDKSTVCPRCYQEDETLEHAILRCPSRAAARSRFLPDLTSLDEIWHSETLLTLVAQYIRATQTGYPHSMSGWPPLSLSRPSDSLSSVCSSDLSLTSAL